MDPSRPAWAQSPVIRNIPVRTTIWKQLLDLGANPGSGALSTLSASAIANAGRERAPDHPVNLSSTLFILCYSARNIQEKLEAVASTPTVYKLSGNFPNTGSAGADDMPRLVLNISIFDQFLVAFCPHLAARNSTVQLGQDDVPNLEFNGNKIRKLGNLYGEALFDETLQEVFLKTFAPNKVEIPTDLSPPDESKSDSEKCRLLGEKLDRVAKFHGQEADKNKNYAKLCLLGQGLMNMLEPRPSSTAPPTRLAFAVAATSVAVAFLPKTPAKIISQDDGTAPKCAKVALAAISPFNYGATCVSSLVELVTFALFDILHQLQSGRVLHPNVDQQRLRNYLGLVTQSSLPSVRWKCLRLGELLDPATPQSNPTASHPGSGLSSETFGDSVGDNFPADSGHQPVSNKLAVASDQGAKDAIDVCSSSGDQQTAFSNRSTSQQNPSGSASSIQSTSNLNDASRLDGSVSPGLGPNSTTKRALETIPAADGGGEPLPKRRCMGADDSTGSINESLVQALGPGSQESGRSFGIGDDSSAQVHCSATDGGFGHPPGGVIANVEPETGNTPQSPTATDPLQHYHDEAERNAEEDRRHDTDEIEKALRRQEEARAALPNFHVSRPPTPSPTESSSGEIEGASHAKSAKGSGRNRRVRRGKAGGAKHKGSAIAPNQRAASSHQREMSIFPHQLEEDMKPTEQQLETIGLSSPGPKWPLLGGKLSTPKLKKSVPIPSVNKVPQPSVDVPFVPDQSEHMELFLKLLRTAMEEKPGSTSVRLMDLSEEEYRQKKSEELQASFKSHHIVVRPSAPVDSSQWSDDRGKINLGLLTAPNRKSEVHNMSRLSTGPGKRQQVTETGTMSQILDHVNDSEFGAILNLPGLPDETGLGTKPEIMRSLDSSEWAYTHTAHLSSMWKNMPAGLLRSFNLASGGVFTMDYVAADGSAKWIHVEKGRGSLCILSLGPKSLEDNLFDNSKPLKPDPWVSDDPSFESLTEQHWWEAVYLPEGSTLVMQPYTPHFMLTLDSTLACEGYFYSEQHLNRTLHAFRLISYHDETIANASHPEAAILLHRMLLYAHRSLDPDQEGASDAAPHMPLPYPIDELAALIYLVGTDPGQDSFLKYFEEEQGKKQTFKAQLAGKQLLQLRPDLRERVELLEGRFKEWADRCVGESE